MHSSLNRVQAVFGFFTTVALVVAGLAALSTLFFPTADTSAAVSLKNVQVVKGRPHYYSTKREEYAQIRFDLDADLSPLFNWNTKQVFVYVYATYSSSDKKESNVPLTEAIIWDAIIPAAPSPYSFDALSEKVLSAIPSSVIPSSLKPAKKSSQKKRPAAKKSAKKGAAAVAEEDTPGKLRLRGQKAKYQISDITGRLAERENVTLSAGWNVQPWVGALWWSPGTGTVPRTQGMVVNSESFDFPPLKVAAKTEGV